jgi:hypothetical protein
VPHVTNIDFEFGVKPRPRSTVLPVAVAPWSPMSVSSSGLRHLPVVPVAAGAAPVVPATGVSVVAAPLGLGVVGTPGSSGPRSAMPVPVTTLVRNPIVRQQYAYQTRVNADGDGASGPYPEREPA